MAKAELTLTEKIKNWSKGNGSAVALDVELLGCAAAALLKSGLDLV